MKPITFFSKQAMALIMRDYTNFMVRGRVNNVRLINIERMKYSVVNAIRVKNNV